MILPLRRLLGTSRNSFTDKFALILRNSSSFKMANITNIRHFSFLLLLDQIQFVYRKPISRGALLGVVLLVSGFAMAAVAQKPASPSPVHWKSMDAALTAAAVDSQLIFVEIHAEWCVPCRIMEQTTFRDSAVAAILNSQFHPVRLDADSEEKISCAGHQRPIAACVSDTWKLAGIPAFVLLAPSGNYLLSVMRFLDAPSLLALLEDFQQSRQALLEREGSPRSPGKP